FCPSVLRLFDSVVTNTANCYSRYIILFCYIFHENPRKPRKKWCVSPGSNPGHGTATLALLAGRPIAIPDVGFDDFLGGAPFAEVIPIRIADSVIHFYTSTLAKGIEYAIDAGCQVVSLSMGGLPARSWAAAVNRAYESGVAIFAAAGNRFGPSPPRSTVYPARFNRVVAVCGVTADGTHTLNLK